MPCNLCRFLTISTACCEWTHFMQINFKQFHLSILQWECDIPCLSTHPGTALQPSYCNRSSTQWMPEYGTMFRNDGTTSHKIEWPKSKQRRIQIPNRLVPIANILLKCEPIWGRELWIRLDFQGASTETRMHKQKSIELFWLWLDLYLAILIEFLREPTHSKIASTRNLTFS